MDSIEKFLDDMRTQVLSLVEEARQAGREEVLSQVQGFVGAPVAKPAGKAKKVKAKGKKKRKNPWAGMTAKQREERIRKMLAARGLEPKDKTKAKPKAKKKRKNPWATMTPEQREERVRKMLAGRGLKPKAKGKAKAKAKAKK